MGYHVLDPIDGSDEAFEALAYSLATFPRASHTTIHVINPTKKRYEGPGHAERWLEKATREAEEVHETARDVAESHGVTLAETVTKRGRPAREVVTYADEHDVDHITVGSTGRSHVNTVFVGSVSRSIIRHAPTPVTVVRNVGRAPPERVLVAFDGSNPSVEALGFALSDLQATHVTSLHVVDQGSGPFEFAEGERPPDAAERAAESVVADARRFAHERDAAIETRIEHGDPASTITTYAIENEFDHLAVGRSGRSGWPRILLGSVAETLVERAPIPITVVG